MRFAQFKSTYKPLPIDVYERTGQELEAKYYRNRETASLFRQAMSNIKVEDRNIGHLAKATTDVEGMLDTVHNKWQYAGNILYNAKDRIINDKALNASIEDFSKSETAKEEEQDRFEKGDIDQAALSAFYTNEKRFNDKAISIDENGQLVNRWNTPRAPKKVDTEKKVLEIADLLTKHKDSIALGVTKKGDPLYEIYSQNPALEGYVNRETASGVSPDKIANAVRNWINSTPEVKQYYNYINDAQVFNMVTEKDDKGNYLKDENGNFIQKPITPADFRAIGIPIMDDWTAMSNVTILPSARQGITMAPIKGISPNFRDTPLYKQYTDAGYSDQEALQQIYKQTLTDFQTDKIVNFGASFGFAEKNTQVIKDEGYWFRKNQAQKKLDEASIWAGLTGKAPLIDAMITFNPKMIEKNLTDLTARRDRYTEGSAEYNQYQNEINNLKTTHKILRGSYSNTLEGQEVVLDLYADFLKQIPSKDKYLFTGEENKKKVIDYITGQSEELGINYDLNIPRSSVNDSGVMILNKDESFTDIGNDNRPTGGKILNSFRTVFTHSFSKAMGEGNINLNINTVDFLDKNGGISKMSENIGENILNRGDSFINLGGLRNDGEKMTLDDYYKEKKIDASKYKPIAQFTDHYGKFVIKFIPRDKTIDPLKDDARLIIEPNADNKDQIMTELANLVQQESANNSSVVNNWINKTRINSVYGRAFEPVYDELALLASKDIPATKAGEIWISNVPIGRDKTTGEHIPGDFKLVFNSNNTVDLFQSDPTHTNIVHRANRKTLEQIQQYLFEQYK